MSRFLPVLFVLVVFQLRAQDYLGFVNSNYSGITGVQLNPANIVNSRMRFDMTLIGLSVNVGNNYVGMKRAALASEGGTMKGFNRVLKGDDDAFPAFKDTMFQSKYLRDTRNGKDKSIFVANRITLPSFMINLGQFDAIGVSVHMRTNVNIDGLSENLARLLYSDVGRMANYNVNDILGKEISNKHLTATGVSWIEYGVTYGHVFKKGEGKNFFKMGVTPKLLQGLAGAYINVDNFKFRFDNDPVQIKNDSVQVLAVVKTQVNYGHSKNLEFPTDPNAPNRNQNSIYSTFNGYPKLESYPGFGLDMGFIYEWRPRVTDYKYDMDGKKDLWRKDKNKYKLKVGVSVVDLGSLKFDKGANSTNFIIDIDTIKYRLLELKDYPVDDIDRIIDSLTIDVPSSKTFKVSMPTAISAQVDYNIWKDFYINLTPYIAFQHTNKEAKVHDNTNISVSPRWDHKWFGLAAPISYNTFYAKAGQPLKFGATARLGPLVIGTNDLPGFFTGDIFGTNLYVMIKLSIPYGHVRDKDKDGISDKKDLCKQVPGVWEFKGCPDRDYDHVQDNEDLCPDVPGTKELRGCPDKDGDGIKDSEDNCPEVKGTAEFKGCPDFDGDKVIDKEDLCPEVAGIAEFKGCPDTDADGVQDSEDLCPDVFGPKEFKGCPDKDGDKIMDKDDACPQQAGPAENKGCPWPDQDKDGIYDKEDSCRTVPGIALHHGCPPPAPAPPPMKAAEKKIIEKAFASLEFATARDVIKPVSFPSLNALATLMVSHKDDWKLKLEGHTDNEGDPDRNMELSQKRAQAVEKYLVKKGVNPDQLVTEWYGQDRPIDNNKTAKGRQRNRRVEMKILSKE